MSHTITERSQIPDAPVYVLCNDSFMSGWGQARGRVNTIILPCADTHEASIVMENAAARSDQKRIRMVGAKPRLRPGILYSLLTKDGADRWYTRGGFMGSDR